MLPTTKNHRFSLKINRLITIALFGLITTGFIWLGAATQQVTLPTEGASPLFYATQCQDDLRLTYIKAINNAKRSIHLVIFTLTDKKVLDALRKKSEEGVEVTIICDPHTPKRGLKKLGGKVSVWISKGPGLMHQKILVIDEKQVWIGSANMTPESLRVHDNLVIGMDNPELAKALIEHGKGVVSGRMKKSTLQRNYTIGGQQVELWMLPENREGLHRLEKLIDGAQKTIRVAMFTWTSKELTDAIIRAHKRGIKVEAVVDYHSSKGASAGAVERMREAGIAVRSNQGIGLLHHKLVYIDNQTLATGSTNWTRAAFTINRDCFLVLHDLSAEQERFMARLWDSISKESTAP